MKLQSINPATGQEIRCYEEMSSAEVETIISNTEAAFQQWRRTDFATRSRLLKQAAQILRDRKDAYAHLMVEEMGKPLSQAVGEVEKCAWVCDFYADKAEEFLKPEVVETDAQKSFVAFQPLGIVFAVMPWNFPFWQVFRFIAPALMAGNAGLLKHAENVTGCALAIEEVIRDAGFPPDIFRSLLVSREGASKVIEHTHVKAVTLTGSTRAGKAVASKAGEYIKKAVLELGGSDPYIILEDADVEAAAKLCVTSRMINGGQSCVAAKRFIVVSSVKERFVTAFLEHMKGFVIGDPLQDGVNLGPMARHDLRDELHKQVTGSVEKGATLLLGGVLPDSPGAYYPATVLSDVKPGMPAYDEEMFGPVASIIEVKDEADAIRVANDSIYGLGGAVFTQDVAKGERIATEGIESGACFVNSFVKSDPRLPFGGIKESGYGRELSSYGIKEFVNIKTVYVQ